MLMPEAMSDDVTMAPAAPDPDGSSGRPDAGYDARREARGLLRTIRSGALATLAKDGAPYASLVSLATLPDGSPMLPLSTLAVHTQHLMADPRCSLLLDGGGRGDPLTHPRLTVSARAVKATQAERKAWRARFLRRHPKAEIYVDFGDFSFWRLDLQGARMIGGFGRIDMLTANDLVTDTAGAEALLEAEQRTTDQLNADHADALKLYATVLAGAPEGQWRVTGVDPDGIDLVCRDDTRRLDFPERVTDLAALRRQLVRWAEPVRSPE